MTRYILWGIACGLIIGGSGWLSAQAHADAPEFDPNVVTYTVAHARDICTQLAADPNNDGVQTAGLRIVNSSHLMVEQAGQVIGLSVRTHCPQWAPQVAAFAAAVQGGIIQ